ncbi:MAG TPA: hypothetical protein VLF18_21880 [Tahibacter sp.]|uniref:hypothetical protein n=1 Tax=Tahibacter sp. TaxID=2056211 RepID=UPI002C075EC0|nr:hypothetical protein [Tahibacter sp.]HSX62842.1 hypothetical protein [Tahibacter sp.]
MQRWHGRIGETTSARGTLARYRVVLRGAPLDSDDFAAVHARLAEAEWAAERVRSVVVYGCWPGDGQLWSPDPVACVTALDATFGAHDRYLQERAVLVETTLTREALARRLMLAFARDRLIDADVDDEDP